jgi:hypothetical protein
MVVKPALIDDKDNVMTLGENYLKELLPWFSQYNKMGGGTWIKGDIWHSIV